MPTVDPRYPANLPRYPANLPYGATLKPGKLSTIESSPTAGLCPPCSRHLKGTVCDDPRVCSCLQCAFREAWRMIDYHLDPKHPAPRAVLAADLARLRDFERQRTERRALRMAKPDREPFPCACGRVRDGQRCMVTGGRLRTRKWASKACKQYGQRLKAKTAKRAAAMVEASNAARVDDRTPHWR